MNRKIAGLVALILLAATTTADGQADWELARDKDGIKVWVKDFPESNFKQFKSEVTMPADLHALVALQLDIANMDKWYDNVGTVTPTKKISDLEGIYVIDFDMPFPVLDRVSAVRARMWYDQATETVHVKTQYEPGIITDTDKVHVKRIQSTWEISPAGEGHVLIKHSGYMDPSGSLPAWLANTGIKDGPVKTFRAMRQILSDYEGQRIAWLPD